LRSQWRRKERVVAVKSDGNLPLLSRLRRPLASSLRLGKLRESMGGSGVSSQRRGDVVREQMASREGKERGC
jgi:hypothetical protein